MLISTEKTSQHKRHQEAFSYHLDYMFFLILENTNI